MPKITRIFFISIFLFFFSTFTDAQAMMTYLHLEVVDSNQKPVADATVENVPSRFNQDTNKTTNEDGSIRFQSWNGFGDLSEMRIVKKNYYPFELFGLTQGYVFRVSSSFPTQSLKVELLKIPKNSDERKTLGDRQLNREFFLAVLKGNAAEVRRLLKTGVNPNITTDDLRGVPVPKEIPAMLYAAYRGDIAVMSEFLTAKIDLRRENSNIRNLLAYYLANLKNPDSTKEQLSVVDEFIDKLLKAGASVNATYMRGQTLLMIATQQNNLELAKKLIENGANVNAKTEYGTTALTDLVYAESGSSPNPQRIEIIKLLLKSGANPNFITGGWNNNCDFPLKKATEYGRLDLTKILLSYKADAIIKCPSGDNVFTVLPDNLELADILINAGADVNAMGERGKTPLMRAVEFGDAALVKKLLNNGASAKTRDLRGGSALKIAQEKMKTAPNRSSFEEIIKIVEASIAEKDARQIELLNRSLVDKTIKIKRPTIFEAIFREQPEIIRWLVNHGANVNEPSENGTIPLIYILSLSLNRPVNLEIVKLLLDLGADPNIHGPGPNTETCIMTPLMQASFYGQLEVIKLLVERKAELDFSLKNGDSALGLAVRGTKPIAATKLLLELGADAKGKNGSFALKVVKDNPVTYPNYNYLDLVKILESYGAKDEPEK